MEQEKVLSRFSVNRICRKNEVIEMIKTKNGTTRFKGTTDEVLNDYRTITKSFLKVLEIEEELTREEAIETLKKVQSHGFMSDEELIENMKEELKSVLKIFVKEREEESNE